MARLGEKLEEQADLLLLSRFEDLGWMGHSLPMPWMNSSSEMRLVSS
jgi:hypothetical protein